MILPVRTAVLSDDRLLREGLLRIVDDEPAYTVVGEANCAAFGPALRAARPDILLVDSRMEGGLELCASLKGGDQPAVILIAAGDDDDFAVTALEAGARGILAKHARAEDLVKAIRVVYEGQIWARRSVVATRMENLAGSSAARPAGEVLEQRLSTRERDVFRQAATGLSNKELAGRLAISEATVKAHLTKIFHKLGLRGRAELAAAYFGITPPLQRTPRRGTSAVYPERGAVSDE
jgi:DNA-binding NarL/FixJ family response regulator